MGLINMKAHRQTDLKRPGQLSEPHRRGNFSLSLMSMISFLSLTVSTKYTDHNNHSTRSCFSEQKKRLDSCGGKEVLIT